MRQKVLGILYSPYWGTSLKDLKMYFQSFYDLINCYYNKKVYLKDKHFVFLFTWSFLKCAFL